MIHHLITRHIIWDIGDCIRSQSFQDDCLICGGYIEYYSPISFCELEAHMEGLKSKIFPGPLTTSLSICSIHIFGVLTLIESDPIWSQLPMQPFHSNIGVINVRTATRTHSGIVEQTNLGQKTLPTSDIKANSFQSSPHKWFYAICNVKSPQL